MSAIVIFFYSKYVPNIQYLIEKVNKLSYCHTICVDNIIVRQKVLASPVIKTKKVPCFVVINPDRTVNQYIDADLDIFLQRMSEIEEEKLKQENQQIQQQQQQQQRRPLDKSPISSVLAEEDFQKATLRQQEPQKPHASNSDMAISSNPSSLTKSDVPIARSKIGEIINYNQTNKPESIKEPSATSSDIMNYNKEKTFKLKPEEQQTAKMSKGQGHDGMAGGMSSLRPDSKKKDLSVIEDIDMEDSSGLISFSNANTSSSQPKNPKDDKNEKKVSEFKSIVNQMMQQRESLLDNMRKE